MFILPNEIICTILDYLPIEYLLITGQVDHKWREITLILRKQSGFAINMKTRYNLLYDAACNNYTSLFIHLLGVILAAQIKLNTRSEFIDWIRRCIIESVKWRNRQIFCSCMNIIDTRHLFHPNYVNAPNYVNVMREWVSWLFNSWTDNPKNGVVNEFDIPFLLLFVESIDSSHLYNLAINIEELLPHKVREHQVECLTNISHTYCSIGTFATLIYKSIPNRATWKNITIIYQTVVKRELSLGNTSSLDFDLTLLNKYQTFPPKLHAPWLTANINELEQRMTSIWPRRIKSIVRFVNPDSSKKRKRHK